MSSQGSPTQGQPMRVICDRHMRRFTSLNLVVKWQAERAGPMGQRREESPDYSGLFAFLNRSTFPSCRKVRAWFTVASPTFTSTAIAIRNPQPSRHAASPPVRGDAMHRVLGRWLWWFKQALRLQRRSWRLACGPHRSHLQLSLNGERVLATHKASRGRAAE
jgi:hypothetical protein